MQPRFLWFAGQDTQFLYKSLLLLQSEVLIAKKDDATSGNDDAEFADKFIGIGCVKQISKGKVAILSTDRWSDFEKVVFVEAASRLERFMDHSGRSDHFSRKTMKENEEDGRHQQRSLILYVTEKTGCSPDLQMHGGRH